MPQQVQELINKIRTEAIDQANDQARELEHAAESKAKDIIKQAHADAEKIVTEAKADVKKMEESGNMALQQASRNMILSLRKDIEKLFNTIVEQEVKENLSGDQLGKIIEEVIKSYVTQSNDSADVQVTISDKDLKALQGGMIEKLQSKIKEPLTFRASENVESGFIISFDQGKSNFEFTDQSLAQFLSVYVNENLKGILNSAA